MRDAVAALARLPAEAMLTIAGDGDSRELAQLRSLARELGVDARVGYLGMRAHAELPAIYEAADAVMFPVRWAEPWGIVPLEAMALGRPVIATGTGGSGEYLRDGQNCVLAAPSDPEALAQAVHRLYEEPALRERLRSGGQRTARRHTETVFNQAVESALARACGL